MLDTPTLSDLPIGSGLILCPLALEAQYLREAFDNMGAKSNLIKISDHQCWQYPDLDFVLGVAGLGAKNYTDVGHKILSGIGAKYLICAGGAGALTKDLNIGDIVIDCPTQYVDRFALIGPAIIVGKGSIATVDSEIKNSTQAKALFQKTSSVAVAWEGEVARNLAKEFKILCVEARGITDNVITKKILSLNISLKSEFKKNLPLAMKNLSEVLYELKDLLKS